MNGRAPQGSIAALFICPTKGQPMVQVSSVDALVARGFRGDRYCNGTGSFQKTPGHRQATLINSKVFEGTSFNWEDSRRNIILHCDFEVTELIGKFFSLGPVIFKGKKYCTVCDAHGRVGFREAFFERGGIILEVFRDGEIKVGDSFVFLGDTYPDPPAPPKDPQALLSFSDPRS